MLTFLLTCCGKDFSTGCLFFVCAEHAVSSLKVQRNEFKFKPCRRHVCTLNIDLIMTVTTSPSIAVCMHNRRNELAALMNCTHRGLNSLFLQWIEKLLFVWKCVTFWSGIQLFFKSSFMVCSAKIWGYHMELASPSKVSVMSQLAHPELITALVESYSFMSINKMSCGFVKRFNCCWDTLKSLYFTFFLC